MLLLAHALAALLYERTHDGARLVAQGLKPPTGVAWHTAGASRWQLRAASLGLLRNVGLLREDVSSTWAPTARPDGLVCRFTS